MLVDNQYHLTYCTNIHPGESWEEVFRNLKSYTVPLKNKIADGNSFGIGLRLSDLASQQLLADNNLAGFKHWLSKNNLYVFTINGFPFGGFHRQRVKDDVHKPDWTTVERLDYTIRLANILSELLPANLEGSISTSPVSYRHWRTDKKETEEASEIASINFANMVEKLYRLKLEKGITIHIDIEPEPDGVIENCEEAISFFKKTLIPEAGKYLQEKLTISSDISEEIIKDHIRLCYDICHSAVMYEEPAAVLKKLEKEGIKIGKMQISSAIKINIGKERSERMQLYERLKSFAGSTYLHQVIGRKADGGFERFPDLAPALENIFTTEAREWRMHFHVPLFTENYNGVSSTGEDIRKTFDHLKKNKFTSHLEIETYTWDILPETMKLDLADSIEREYRWVLKNLV
jgi:sugar phosphate isomerase/epimerase